MPLPDISLSQFNRIATGKYNAGFVDFQTDDQGNLTGELAKVNNHVHATGKNKATLSSARVLEVKEAFIAAMERAMVPEDTIREIRRELGIAKELDATGDTARLGELAAARFKPLSRQQVRETEPPSTFASGITDILFDNFRVVSSALGGDSGAIVSDARRIAVDELHADISENAFTLFAIPTIVNAIQEDAEGAGDDNSYKIDIGI